MHEKEFSSTYNVWYLRTIFAYYGYDSGQRLYVNRSSRPEVFWQKAVPGSFAKFTGKHLCHSLFLNKVEAYNFIKKETLAQVFFCEFYEIYKNTLFLQNSSVTKQSANAAKHKYGEENWSFEDRTDAKKLIILINSLTATESGAVTFWKVYYRNAI